MQAYLLLYLPLSWRASPRSLEGLSWESTLSEMIVWLLCEKEFEGAGKEMYREAKMDTVSNLTLSRLAPSGQRPSVIHLHSSDGLSGLSCSVCWMKEWMRTHKKRWAFPAQPIHSSRLVPWNLWFLGKPPPWPRNELGKECMQWLQQPFLLQTARSEEGAQVAWTPILHSANYSWEPALHQLGKGLHSCQLPKPRLL